MKNIVKGIVIIGIILTSLGLRAQQESLMAFYNDHLNLVNPAFVGVDSIQNLKSTIRTQWNNVADSPETYSISFNTPIGRNLYIGVSYVHDKVFIEKNSFISIDFSYKLQVSDQTVLFMGVKAGANDYNLNIDKIETYNAISDPSIQPLSIFNPNFGVGFYLKNAKYYVTLSSPKLLNSRWTKDDGGYSNLTTERSHYYIGAGYEYDLSQDVMLRPSIFTRYVKGAPLSTDFTLISNVNKMIDFGMTYRTSDFIVGFTQLYFNDKVNIGLAYEFSTSSTYRDNLGSTTEIFVKVRL